LPAGQYVQLPEQGVGLAFIQTAKFEGCGLNTCGIVELHMLIDRFIMPNGV